MLNLFYFVRNVKGEDLRTNPVLGPLLHHMINYGKKFKQKIYKERPEKMQKLKHPLLMQRQIINPTNFMNT